MRRRQMRRFTCPRCSRPDTPFYGNGAPYPHTCIGVAPLNLDGDVQDRWLWLRFPRRPAAQHECQFCGAPMRPGDRVDECSHVEGQGGAVAGVTDGIPNPH